MLSADTTMKSATVLKIPRSGGPDDWATAVTYHWWTTDSIRMFDCSRHECRHTQHLTTYWIDYAVITQVIVLSAMRCSNACYVLRARTRVMCGLLTHPLEDSDPQHISGFADWQQIFCTIKKLRTQTDADPILSISFAKILFFWQLQRNIKNC